MGKSTRAGLAGTDMNTAFKVRNLYAFYGKKRPKDSENMVLRDVNLVIPSGSALGIIGPNGAGKSTLLRALAGIIPSEGEIYLFGEPLAEKKRREIACCCALMSQFFPVGFAYSVRKTVVWRRQACRSLRIVRSQSYPAGSFSVYSLPGRLPRKHRFCCWMNRPAAWISNTRQSSQSF